MSMRARTLQQLVPEARIGVAHGQMAADELEAIMLGFEEGAFDVLLATTIVESGLDVAGANTLIIERADRLGLAQLYQLRGRVGRRQTEAWAYLLYPGRLTEQAQRRLYAIAELNDLGSGHLLAEKDMEIRGVGNLLGPEQHGHVSAVSLEVYTELLAEEVAKLKGEEKAAARPAVSLDLNVDARLTPAYLPNDDERIAFYGRLAEAEGLAEVSRIARELRAARGPFPPEVKAFLELVKLRLLAEGKGVAAISEHMTDVQVSFRANFDELDYDPRKLRDLPFTAEATRYPPGFSVKKRGWRLPICPSRCNSCCTSWAEAGERVARRPERRRPRASSSGGHGANEIGSAHEERTRRFVDVDRSVRSRSGSSRRVGRRTRIRLRPSHRRHRCRTRATGRPRERRRALRCRCRRAGTRHRRAP